MYRQRCCAGSHVVHISGGIEPGKTPTAASPVWARIIETAVRSPGRRKAGSCAEPRPDWLDLDPSLNRGDGEK